MENTIKLLGICKIAFLVITVESIVGIIVDFILGIVVPLLTKRYEYYFLWVGICPLAISAVIFASLANTVDESISEFQVVDEDLTQFEKIIESSSGAEALSKSK